MYSTLSVLLCLLSCSKNSDEEITLSIAPSNVTLHSDETFQMSGTNVAQWKSKDYFVAEVNEKGFITGRHVGTTQIVASNGKESAICEVTIVPRYDLFDTPILEWGASKSTIQSKENHQQMTSSSTSTMLAYDYSKNNKSCALFYYFSNGKLSRIDAYMDLLQYVNVGSHLTERYAPLNVEDDLVMFADGYTKGEMTTVVGLQTQKISGTELTYISYIPSNQQNSPQQ